jgi:hypothetical protein
LCVDDSLLYEVFHDPEMDAQLALCPFRAVTAAQVGRQNILLAAMKTEERGGGIGWEEQIPEIIE